MPFLRVYCPHCKAEASYDEYGNIICISCCSSFIRCLDMWTSDEFLVMAAEQGAELMFNAMALEAMKQDIQ